MPHPVAGIDHVFLLVNDLDASARDFAKLGFTLSPRGLHSPAMGSANYTVMFRDDYLELLGIIAPTEHNAPKRQQLLEDGQGLSAIACRIDDARTACAALAELGIETTPVMDFSRPLPLPDGTEGIASFAVSSFADKEVPLGNIFMCQHNTRDMVWRPELLDHANGAVGLDAVVASSGEPAEIAARFARLYGGGTVSRENDGRFVVTTGANSARIICLTPEEAGHDYSPQSIAATPSAGFAALRVRVSDVNRTERLLAQHGVQTHKTRAGGIWVAPEYASGTIMHFVQA